jgi:hypothetical protein
VSAEILNLRLARKRRERREREEEAGRNRLLHGETKAARSERRLAAAKEARDLDAHRRETGQEPSDAAAGQGGEDEN